MHTGSFVEFYYNLENPIKSHACTLKIQFSLFQYKKTKQKHRVIALIWSEMKNEKFVKTTCVHENVVVCLVVWMNDLSGRGDHVIKLFCRR